MTVCNQCQKPFEGAGSNCAGCKELLRLHSTDREEYLRRRRPRHTLDDDAPLRVTLNEVSGNKKTGRIPVTISSPGTCPTSCAFRGQGCYGEFGFLRHHWARTPTDGMTWSDFCAAVSRFKSGQAGDLPGVGDDLDVEKLAELVDANERAGAKGFTLTHKPLVTEAERDAVVDANARGFTINISADGMADVDRARALGAGPVAVVVAADAPRSPGYVLCPFETDGITCKRCRLCTVPSRRSIVAFRAHGQFSARVDEICQAGAQ